VLPESIPDWLALVGDSSDGYPGLKGWGAKSTAAVLRRYPHIEEIPARFERWDLHVSGARRLASVLVERMDDALLFRTLATLRLDADVGPDVEAMRWRGPTPELAAMSERLNAAGVLKRYEAVASR
jgi:5'-3' exonuclease